jgi:hypothetical protein
VRAAALDGAIAKESGDASGYGRTQADILTELSAAAELFHVPDAIGFADFHINRQR